MTDLINDILTTYVLPGMILGFGLCFLAVMIPGREGLRGYRMARRMMGGAYVFFFAALVAETFIVNHTLTGSVVGSSATQQMLMVTIGIVQAFLFTYALTTLIDVHFFTWHRLRREALLVLLPAVAVMAAAVLTPFGKMGGVKLLSLFYLYKLVDYVRLFRQRYRDYERRMADYFSDDERKRLLWVSHSFYAALAIGILALLYALFPTTLTCLIFTLVMAVYYAAFAIRFINYAFMFQQIEVAITNDHSPSNIDHTPLMSRLSALMASERLYAKPDLTIEEVAVLVGESHRTVSAAINSTTGLNYKSWVNTYRVEEAQRLIRDGYLNDHTIDALAEAVGFANRISLYRNFKKHTGQSPAFSHI